MKRIVAFFVISLVILQVLFSEETIVPFNERIALNFSGKYNIGIFQHDGTSYRTNKPWDIGIGIRYKNIAAQAYIPLSCNNDSFDVAVNFYLEKMYYEIFMKRYTNFHNDADGTSEKENVGLDIMSGGIMAGWIHNHQNHSLRSVFTLSEKQTVSCGSFLYGFGVAFCGDI
ncbi:hypothetical protein AGMMS49944_32010 [Spirochaetia bacterium]|nr:hypothetical protein AGMMS49944_32010 [Spirochaetia bacterium]